MATYEGDELTKALTRLSAPAYKWRIDRKKAIELSSKMCADALVKEIEGKIVDGVDSVVKEVSGRVNYSVQKQVGVAIDWTLPNKRQLEAVHKSIGVYDKVKLWSAGELEDARTRISEGILNGHSYNDIARQVSKDSGKEAYKAKRLVRTTMAQASVDAEVKVLKENGVKEYEIFCTLDERTCPICSKYDGKKYKLGDGPMPTFHPNCRCSITQVLPDEMKERARRAARDENGKTIQVPRNMTYDQWREKYGPKTSVPAPKAPSTHLYYFQTITRSVGWATSNILGIRPEDGYSRTRLGPQSRPNISPMTCSVSAIMRMPILLSVSSWFDMISPATGRGCYRPCGVF